MDMTLSMFVSVVLLHPKVRGPDASVSGTSMQWSMVCTPPPPPQSKKHTKKATTCKFSNDLDSFKLVLHVL